MKAALIAVGVGMPAWVQDGFAEYSKRLAHWLPLQLIELTPGERGKSRDPQRAMEDEAKRLIAAVPKGAVLVLLDSRGKSYSSEALSERLQHWRMQGRDLAFLIGGPDGFAAEVRGAASESWSLGPLTLPHPLVRVIVAEQLFRAASILANHPYHRGG
ncbi:MAG: Ribosomal RNA large subunit methyltransferase H [Alphaproteobacteria bacterium ADurb.BinA280]|jgi:23S rRNA (pseudouridine1915-N3)-methyltransferase|nr:23S rRNA (pseudouridine(1915)-N(3))-methyltransferase RlmH [Xanthomonadales bacterium]MCC6506601.1 23S rRNA (pseudouridine(1915)-N(3))-methyltransferase RlmH [Aquimonas sp.]OPZ13440.1 MAG: Ribosomal RNA large subunit methyltransferase H [Alphaproteobacteria bacterium ADurb.BinA280]